MLPIQRIDMKTKKLLTLAAMPLALALSGYSGEKHKHSPQLEGLDPNSRADVIVQFNGVPTSRHHQKVRAHGGDLKADLHLVNGGHYSLPASEIEALAADPDVKYISLNHAVSGAATVAGSIAGPTVYSNVANAEGFTGTGIGVAVIDSGVHNMSEFQNGPSRVVYSQSFVPNLPNLNVSCPGGGTQMGAWYSSTLNVQGGLAPYTVSIASGSLPPGLSLDAATGNVTGIPTTATSSNIVFTVAVADSAGNTRSQSCNMNVGQAQTGSPKNLNLGCWGGGAQANAWYDSVLNAQGGVPPYRFSISYGSLPAGLSLNTYTGAVSGTPTTATSGSQNFVLQLTDSSGNSFNKTCSLSVGQAQQIQMTNTDDQYGHGTHVAGIVTSNGNNTPYIGIAPGVNIVNLRVLDQNGNGTDANVIQGIQAAVSLAKTWNIRVLNLSLGRPVFESYTVDPLCQAVEQAWKAGIVVVVAAGNQGRNNAAGTFGYGTITAPGNDPYAITVGAMKIEGTTLRTNDTIASYSSKGPTLFDHVVKPDIVAPGNLIISTMAGATLRSEFQNTNQVNGDFFILSGTSMATPVVSGAAALLLQQTPSLTPDQVKARLMRTATKTFPTSSVAVDPITNISYTSYYDIFTGGAGYLDVTAALSDTTAVTGSALSPIATYNAQNGTVSMTNIAGQGVIWGTGVNWGTSVIWGTSAVSGSGIIWGTSVIWGTNTTQALNLIWGSSVIWGTGLPAGEATSIAINGEQ